MAYRLRSTALRVLLVLLSLACYAQSASAQGVQKPQPAAGGVATTAPPRVTRDAAGRTIAITDARGHAIRYEYVANTQTLKAIVHADGTRQEFEYDAGGRLLVERIGGIVVRAFSYLTDGKLATLKEIGEPEIRFTYDADGRLKSEADALGNGTHYEYDGRGNVLRETNPLGGVTVRSYDAQNRLTSATGPTGGITRYQYDAGGRLTQETDPVGGIVRYAYDDKGRLVTETNPAGLRTQYEYTPSGWLAKIVNSNGQSASYSYDAQGNVVEETDPFGVRQQHEYDAEGRVVRTRIASGFERTFRYDAAGNVIGSLDSAGATRSYEADAYGRVTAETDPLAIVTKYRWDASGNLVAIMDGREQARQFSYTATGALAGVREPTGDESRYEYDAAGRLSTIRRPSAGVVAYSRDAAGNVLSATDPTKIERRYGYDLGGRRTSVTDATGRVQRFSYDAGNRLVEISRPGETPVTFKYDALHNLVAADDGLFPIRWSYDAAGNVTSTEYPSLKKTIRVEYDARGRRSRLIDPDGRTIQYLYNPTAQLATVVLPKELKIELTYTPGGLLQTIRYPNGVRAEWTYDKADNPVTIAYRNRAGETLRSVSYAYDAVGNVTKKSDSRAGEVQYEFDAASQLIEETAGRSRVRYRYGPGGNRVARESADGVTSYRHDAADRLIAAGATTWSHDSNGYPAARKDADGVTAYEFSAAGKLVKLATPGGGGVTLQYGPTGERIAHSETQSTKPGTTYYLYDGQDLLQQLDGQGRTLATFVHGLGVDRPFAVLRGNDVFFLHADRNGSIVLVTDASGAVAGNYDYDAFGNDRPIPAGGAGGGQKLDPQLGAFGFTGREREGSTGLYFYRSRHYAPAMGRFLTADVLIPLDDAIDLNPYVYVRNNPVTLVDPDGLTGQRPLPTGGGRPFGPPLPPAHSPSGGWNPAFLVTFTDQGLLDDLADLRAALANAGEYGREQPNYVRNLKVSIERIRTILQARGVPIPASLSNTYTGPRTDASNASGSGASPRPRTNTGGGTGSGARPRPGFGAFGRGPRTGQVAAPAAGPVAQAPSVPAAGGVAPVPNRPGFLARNAGVITIVLTAAQLAQCYAETLSGEACLARFAVSLVTGGLVAGAQYVAVAYGGPVIATFATGLSVTGAVVMTGVAVYAAYTEGLNAYAAMHEADRSIITALRGLQRQLEGLREARNNILSADSLAVAALQNAEQARSRAGAAIDAIERALQGVSATSQLCADAATLQTRIDGFRADILTKLRTIQQMLITSRSLIAGCKTAADAQAILNGYNNAKNTLQEIETAARDAEAARRQLMTLLPRLIRGGPSSPLLAYVEQLDNAITLINAAEDEVVKVTPARETARRLLADYATRISNLTRDVGQLEQNYLNLSFREWVLASFGGARPDVKTEIGAARSVLKVHDEPLNTRINTEDFQRRVTEVTSGSTSEGGLPLQSLRNKAKELETRILGARCDFTDSADAIDRIRLLLEDARIEFGKGSDLPAAAAACQTAPLQQSTTQPSNPQTTGQSKPPRPTDPEPPTPPTRTQPGGTGVTFTPGPPPVLSASLDCGPILELVPGQNSKTCNIIVRGWRSDTTTPVEVIVGPLLPGLQASPGNTSQAGDTMYAAGVSDRSGQYVFGQGFSAARGTAAGSQPLQILVRQRGHGAIPLMLTLNIVAPGSPAGITISPPAPNVAGSGGPFCVWQYKLTGDRAECWNFVGAVCTSTRYGGRPEYVQVGNNMTWGQADARIGQLSSYFNDQYGCRGQIDRPTAPPPPPAVVQQGTGGTSCVWRYKLFGDPPQCFHYAAAQCGKYGAPYELVGANMTPGQASARIAELSRYFSDQMGCRAGTTTEPPPPTTPATTTPDPVVPTTPPPAPVAPDPPAAPRGRTLSRFGIAPATISVNVGDTVQLRAFGTYSDAPDTVVEITGVQWSGDKPQSFKVSQADAGRVFVINARTPDGATGSATVTVSAAGAPGGNVPSLLGGSTTRTDPGTIVRGGTGTPLNTPPPPPTPPSPPSGPGTPPGPGGGAGSGAGAGATGGNTRPPTGTIPGGPPPSPPSGCSALLGDCSYDGTWEFTHKPVWGDKAGQPGSGTLVLRKMDQASGRAEHARLFLNSISVAANRCKGPSDVFYSGEITFASPPGGPGAEPFSNAKVLACAGSWLYGWFGPATDPTRAHFEVSGSDKNVDGKMEGVELPWSWVTWKKR